MLRKTHIVANWKMNGNFSFCNDITDQILKSADYFKSQVVICPPFPFLYSVKQYINNSNIKLGSQNICAYDDGAYHW